MIDGATTVVFFSIGFCSVFLSFWMSWCWWCMSSRFTLLHRLWKLPGRSLPWKNQRLLLLRQAHTVNANVCSFPGGGKALLIGFFLHRPHDLEATEADAKMKASWCMCFSCRFPGMQRGYSKTHGTVNERWFQSTPATLLGGNGG